MLEVGGSKQHEEQVDRPYLLSIITPAYNEANNLPALYKRLNPVLDSLKLDWEWIIVDDHSSDRTFTLIKELNKTDPRVNGIRFSRNFGSHLAITCGLHHSRGNCAIIMAADLQDPPETLPLLLKEWEEGAKIVFAVRAHREGEKASKVGFSRLFFFLMRFVVGIRELPSTGSDFFLLDQHVVDAFCQFKESNLSILPLITWLGFRQTTITYTKEARAHGRSGWSLGKKLKLVVDSITSFSYFPIHLISLVGFIVSLIGFCYAGVVIFNALTGNLPQGWSSLMVVLLVIGGFQMLMMGVLGEYLWRALDESRRRPRYLIEAKTGSFAPTRDYQEHS